MKTIGIIPARYASTRFPGKPLEMLGDKSVIQRVYEQAIKARRLDEVIVATDDQRIKDHVLAFEGQCMMTSVQHRSGTDRCAEVADKINDADIVVNIQGDEPFIDPVQIDQTVEPIARRTNVDISTLARKITKQESLLNPNVVKVVISRKQRAMYFSRSTIPFLRGIPTEQWLEQGTFYQHIGLYAFRASVLKDLTLLSPSQYEQLESLEQLRWLEEDYGIFVSLTEKGTIGIDTPEDLEYARSLLG